MVLAVSVDLSIALLPFLGQQVAAGSPVLPDACPADLVVWLSRCNGLLLADGTWLLGWGGHLDSILRMESVLESYPGFAENNWWPVASDGCGNYWVLADDGVAFVDCAEDPGRRAYIVSSTLDRFLVPFLLPFLDQKGWPFEYDTVKVWDPTVVSSDQTKAWEA